MFEVGRLVLKITGKEKGRLGVIVSLLKDDMVLIDGNLKRRKCSMNHIIPQDTVFDIRDNEQSDEIRSILKTNGLLQITKEHSYKPRPRMQKLQCESCGMPINKGKYCEYCVDKNGKLKSREEVKKGWIEYMMSSEKLSKIEAENKVEDAMSKLPAWKK